jgi:pimeloyl-ACP methyl ester carboxylesterase
VLDAVGSERAAVVAHGDSGPIAILFAAMHPQRVSALVLFYPTARYLVAPDYPIGMSPELVEQIVEGIGSSWGDPESLRGYLGDDADRLEYWAMLLRASVTPRAAAAQYRYLMTSLDVRQALPLIQAPTLILTPERAIRSRPSSTAATWPSTSRAPG